MNKKIILLALLIAVFVGGGSFYGGMKYQQGKNSSQGNLPNLRNLSAEQRQQMEAGAIGAFRGNRAGAENSGFASGEILSKDEKSATLKLRDGGSKIIFFSDSTEITKSASGAGSDLEVGKTITVNGTVNQDGSITATSIQLRPAQPTPPANN